MSKQAALFFVAVLVAFCHRTQGDYYAPLPHPCDRPCPYNYQPVCASNGVTYPNTCAFSVANCKRPFFAKLWILFYGECPFYYKD